LGLGLSDPGFHTTVLCKFRKRLIEHQAETRLLDGLLEACVAQGFLKSRNTMYFGSSIYLILFRF